jgi:peptidoglycan biosynthesis protein MviN/MurJ (putative lipid II flippase)
VFLIVGVSAVVKMGSITGAVWVGIAAAALERGAIGYKLARALGITRADWHLFSDIPKIALCSVAAALPAWGCRIAMQAYHPAIVLALCSAVYGIVYVSAALALKIPQRDEKDAIVRYARKFLRVPGNRPLTLTGRLPNTDPNT